MPPPQAEHVIYRSDPWSASAFSIPLFLSLSLFLLPIFRLLSFCLSPTFLSILILVHIPRASCVVIGGHRLIGVAQRETERSESSAWGDRTHACARRRGATSAKKERKKRRSRSKMAPPVNTCCCLLILLGFIGTWFSLPRRSSLLYMRHQGAHLFRGDLWRSREVCGLREGQGVICSF